MRTDIPFFLWDSSVFLAWLKGEQDKDLRGVEHFLSEWKSGRVGLAFSVVSRIEVPFRLGQNQEKLQEWNNLLQPNESNKMIVHEVFIDDKIAERASQLRIRLRDQNQPDKSRLPLADALILASAEEIKAEALYTFDEEHLLVLDGNHDITSMPIVKPPPPQQPDLPL